jgi:hypothetical protein
MHGREVVGGTLAQMLTLEGPLLFVRLNPTRGFRISPQIQNENPSPQGAFQEWPVCARLQVSPRERSFAFGSSTREW